MLARSIALPLLVAIVSLSQLACSRDDDLSEHNQVLVDLSVVIEEKTVAPVDGISSAGQPSKDALQIFADSGYVAVIDIRGTEENRGFDEVAVIAALEMSYIAFPISGADAISFENAAELEALIGAQGGPVLVHCASGNRVGALLALQRSQAGASYLEALQYGRAAGLKGLQPLVEQMLAAH
ncbi:MAG: hypothetical protein ACI87W_001001 [Halieaceae bacterium]|jgi:uncharacterized protein (TIGR01244 family)